MSFAARAEQAGFDSVWVQDQVFGTLARLEPLAVLASVASHTERVALGAAVVVLPGRSPMELARTAVTLDHLSRGRLILGLAGGSADTARRMGLEPQERLPRLAEGIEAMRALWTGNRAQLQGRYWHLDEAVLAPRPIQDPHPPLWLGGSSRAALRLAARVGDGWIGAGSTSIRKFRTHVDALHEQLGATGKIRSRFPVAKRLYLQIADSNEAALRVRQWFRTYYGREELANAAVVGSASDCVAAIMQIVAAGVGTVILSPVIDEEEQLEIIASDVLPEIRRRTAMQETASKRDAQISEG